MKGRNLIIAGISVGLSVALLTGAACGQPADKTDITTQQTPPATATLEQEIQQFYPPLSKIPIKFESYELQILIPEYVRNKIIQQVPEGLLQDYNTLKSKGFPALPDGVSELTITSVETNYVPSSTENLEQKIQTAQKSIEHMKEFLSNTGLKFPEVEFVVAKNSQEIEEGIKRKTEGSEIDKTVIYPIQLTKYYIRVEGRAKYGSQILSIGMTMQANERGGGGKIERELNFKGELGSLSVAYIPGNIVWFESDSLSQVVFETPALEVLHVAVGSISEQYAKQLVQSATTSKEVNEALDRAVSLEEYVVHSIGRHWFRKINDEWNLGYNIDTLLKQNKVSLWWLDPNVDRIEKYVAKVGPAAVIEMYHNNPKKLISEAKLNME